jgi:3-hydroxyacyl-[acyl-carrier-protein] dehydratase
MKFQLIDRVLSCEADRIVAVKHVTAAEEYLADHFPGFPVLPGVMMLEALVQAAREWLARSGRSRYVLGEVKTLRYGNFVRPGEGLRVEVALDKEGSDGCVAFKGSASVIRPDAPADETAVSGRFTMRPVRWDPPASGT